MKRTALFVSISTCAMLIASAAQAQVAPATPPENGASPAPLAQTDPAAGPSADRSNEDIVVTGSRIARPDYSSASPIVTLGQAALQRTASVNIETSLNQLPQFAPGQNSSAIGAVANGGRATLNLRGLGETRNLILLDGRRLPLSSAFGIVDINNIPPNMLDGIETVSGGASAVYGSDAISGVVNFKTKKKFSGVQIDGRFGQSFKSDAKTYDISALTGISSSDGRGNALLSMGYSKRELLFGSQRPDFFGLGVLSSFIGQGTYVPSATNLPSQAAVNGVFAGYGVAPGAVINTRSLGFNDDGTLFQQVGANNYKGPQNLYYTTYGGSVRQPVAVQEYLIQPLTRFNLFGKADYEVSRGLTVYAQILHTDSRVTGQVGYSPTLYNIPSIPVTNPFIPAALRTILASRPNPTAAFTLNQRFTGFDDRKFISDSNVSQYIIGARGNLPIMDWKYDIYGLHDSTDLVETQDKALLLSKMQTLLNAPDGGASICAGGFNPFGLANQSGTSAACKAYIQIKTHDFTRTRQDVVEGNITGRVFTLPAGDVRFSATGTYRHNSFSYDPDPSRQNSDIIGTLAAVPASGAITAKEGAIEFLVPILKDKRFFQSLDLSAGYRYSDYNITGSFSTYKVDATWKPIRALLIRGGYERAVRAPNIGELFSTAQTAQVQIGSPPGAGDPCDNRSSGRTGSSAAQLRTLCVATGVPASIVDTYQYTTVAVATVSSGSTALTPETADTFTAGAALTSPASSPWLSGLSVSLDYYNISIKNVISQVSGVTTLNKCYNLDGSNPTYSAANIYCSLINRDATGGVNTISTPYLNLGGLRTSGFDLQTDWKLNLRDTVGAPGALDLNVVVNFTQHYQVQILPGSPFVEYAGTIDGTQAATTPPVGLPLPKSKIFANLNYSVGPVELGARWRHLPGMLDVTSVTRPASPAPGVPSYDTFDINAAWNITKQFRLLVGITNLTDRQPLLVSGTLGVTQPSTYDIIGRSLFVSATARF